MALHLVSSGQYLTIAQLSRSAVRLFTPDAGPHERFVASGLCAVTGIIAAVLQSQGAVAAMWFFIAASYLLGGSRATLEAISALRTWRPDINVLMILAAVVSAITLHWDEGAILLFLFSLSDALERFAIERTRRGISSLMNLRPEKACLVRDDRELHVPLAEIRADDVVRVRPGERFPVDGVVLDGESAVDESIVTGESAPVEKQPGSKILAGTINANGSLLVRVSRPASESTLARIVRLVEEAQERRVTAQRVIERWQSPYVLTVLVVSIGTMLLGMLISGDIMSSIHRGMVLLVAASPCAVVLASPVAVLATVTHAARSGVLFKGGSHIERLATVSSFAFDKTGTLTRGRPVVRAVSAQNGNHDELLAVAAALEHRSEHPVARAITAAAAARGLSLPEIELFSSEPGFGVWGRMSNHWVGVGQVRLFQQHGIELPQELIRAARESADGTKVLVMRSDGLAGTIDVADEVRREAKQAIEQLRAAGITGLTMLTGDHAAPAERIAATVGITDVRSGLTPADKLTAIMTLAKSNGGVAMVGDGVNDAPALAAATVGIAMGGGGGADVALETADVVLMREDLCGISRALSLARRCRSTIQQSLLFAFGMIFLLVLLTMLGWLSLPFAVIGHEGSTVAVVLYGLRLLADSRKQVSAETQRG
ncbi:MAG: cation-translocating P-type ATPase [Phycisphaerales bacterium]|nr:cation-translocating P-type ATPase [Phycisphaerales bacterium]